MIHFWKTDVSLFWWVAVHRGRRRKYFLIFHLLFFLFFLFLWFCSQSGLTTYCSRGGLTKRDITHTAVVSERRVGLKDAEREARPGFGSVSCAEMLCFRPQISQTPVQKLLSASRRQQSLKRHQLIIDVREDGEAYHLSRYFLQLRVCQRDIE